jgi:processing peptidase subunit alpha
MRSSAQRQLAPWLSRQMASAGAEAVTDVRSAAPRVVRAEAAGMLSWLTGAGSRVTTPLDEPLADVVSMRPNAPPAAAPTVATSALAPGVTAAALAVPGATASLAVFLDAGAAHEGPAATGACAVLRAMAFTATRDRSTFRLTRELEKYGLSTDVTVGREHFALTVTGPKAHTAEAAELLLDAASNLRLSPWEVADAAAVVQASLAAALASPAAMLPELLHRAAFSGGLSAPLLPEPAAIGRLSGEALEGFVHHVLAPSRMVLAAAGVDVGALASIAGPLVAGGHRGAGAPAPASQYVGGSMNCVASLPTSHLAVAFEVAGGASDPKTAALAAVVTTLLDGGARRTLPHVAPEADVAQLAPLCFMYRSTGLLGLRATSAPGAAAAAGDAISRKLEALAKGVSPEALAAAKALTVGAYEASLATRAGAVSEIGAALLARGKFDRADFAAKVGALSAADVSGFVAKLVKGAPSVVSYGSLSALPRADVFTKRLA